MHPLPGRCDERFLAICRISQDRLSASRVTAAPCHPRSPTTPGKATVAHSRLPPVRQRCIGVQRAAVTDMAVSIVHCDPTFVFGAARCPCSTLVRLPHTYRSIASLSLDGVVACVSSTAVGRLRRTEKTSSSRTAHRSSHTAGESAGGSFPCRLFPVGVRVSCAHQAPRAYQSSASSGSLAVAAATAATAHHLKIDRGVEPAELSRPGVGKRRSCGPRQTHLLPQRFFLCACMCGGIPCSCG